MSPPPVQSADLIRRAPGGWLVLARDGTGSGNSLRYLYTGEGCLDGVAPHDQQRWRSLCWAWADELCRRQGLGDSVSGLSAEVGLRQLLAAARAQRLDSVVATVVTDLVTAGSAPAFIGREATAAHRSAIEHTVEIDAAALELLGALEDAGAAPVVLKGMAFAALAYPDQSLRSHHDLDVLVRADRLGIAGQCLRDLGGLRRFGEPAVGFDRRFSKGFSVRVPGLVSIEVDVHRTLADGPFGIRVDVAALHAEAQPFTIAGQRLRALPPAARFVHACLHAVLGRAGFPLAPLLDVAMTAPRTESDAHEVKRVARAWDCEAIVAGAVDAVDSVMSASTAAATPAERVERLWPSVLIEWVTDVRASRDRRLQRQRHWIEVMVGPARSRVRRHLATAAAIDGVASKARYLTAVGWPQDRSVWARLRRLAGSSSDTASVTVRSDAVAGSPVGPRPRTGHRGGSPEPAMTRWRTADTIESAWVEDHLLVREVTTNRLHVLSTPVAAVLDAARRAGATGVSTAELHALFRERSGLPPHDAEESMRTSLALLEQAGLIEGIGPDQTGGSRPATVRTPCLGCGDRIGTAEAVAAPAQTGGGCRGVARSFRFPVGSATVRVRAESSELLALARWWAEPLLSLGLPAGDQVTGSPGPAADQLRERDPLPHTPSDEFEHDAPPHTPGHEIAAEVDSGHEIEVDVDADRDLAFLALRCNRVASSVDDGLALHAAACTLGSAGVVISGRSGCGKSTLVAALVQRGATYLTDEVCVLDVDERTHRHTIRPYPKRLELDVGSRQLLGLDDRGVSEATLGYLSEESTMREWMNANVDPRRLRRGSLPGHGTRVPVCLIVHPVIAATPGRARVRALEPPAAALVLSRAVLNFERLGQRGLDRLAELLETTPVYQLQFAEVGEACVLLDQLLVAER